MKRLLTLFIMIGSILLLVGCANKLPVTSDEYEFSEIIKSLSGSVVSIESSGLSTKNIGTGIIYEKATEGIINTYYVLTATEVVNNILNIKVYISETTSYGAVVIGKYDEISVVKFESTQNLKPINLEKIENPDNLLAREVFSIGTPISQSYYNMPTNPARVSKINEDIIVHSTNLNNGHLGSPLFLKTTGQLVGINISYSTYINDRPIDRINEALLINTVIDKINNEVN